MLAEGDLLASAGVSWTVGRESMVQYNETEAGRMPLTPKQCAYGLRSPINAFDDAGRLLPMLQPYPSGTPVGALDNRVMSYCYRVCLTNTTNPNYRVEIARPAG